MIRVKPIEWVGARAILPITGYEALMMNAGGYWYYEIRCFRRVVSYCGPTSLEGAKKQCENAWHAIVKGAIEEVLP